MRRILQAAPGVHIPPETYVLGSTISIYRRSQHLPWPHLVRLVLAQFEFHRDFDDFQISLRPLANRLVDVPPGERSLARLLDAFYRYHGEACGRRVERWGDKTPLNAYSVERIRWVFPEARFVHVVRDGVDVVHSYLESGLIGDLEEAALRWRTSVESVLAFARRHPRSCHEVRYEELVAEPERVAEEVCRFLGIAFSSSMVHSTDHVDEMADLARYDYYRGVGEPITTDSVGRGRRVLVAEERRALRPLIGPLLERLGYPSPE